ncbi:MAG: DUF1778 domain-containing protein [Cyanobacteria bacterium J06648_1]
MTKSAKKHKSSETLNLRISPAQRELIDTAAGVCGKTRTSFILDSVSQAAENLLSERNIFILSEEQWAEFDRVLDAAPQDNSKLAKMLDKKAPWE